MREIHIGQKIAQKRKEKGITQEQLANFLNVSIPAVSKWESDKCYPDLTFLPLLASYFQISIDELIGYEPYISKSEARALYRKFCKDFTTDSFEEVHQKIRETSKKYYACYDLQFQMGLLLVNHAEIAPNQSEFLQEALGIFNRIIVECQEVSLKKQAIHLKALCQMMYGTLDACIETLQSIVEPLISADPLLAQAYAMQGDLKQAESIAQSFAFQTVCALLDTGKMMMQFYASDLEKAKRWGEKMLQVAEIMGMQKSHPVMIFQLNLALAAVFSQGGRLTEALMYLEDSIDCYTKEDFFPVQMKENDLFTSLDGFFERLELSNDAPRDEKLIKQSVKTLLNASGPFEALKDDVKFKQILKRIDNC